MLDSIAKLGEELLSESPDLFFESLVKYKEKPKEEGRLIRIIFDVKRKKISKDELKLNKSRCKEYWWIGNTFKAAREPILRLTSDNLKYLLRDGDGVDGIITAIEEFPKELKKKSLEHLYHHLKVIKESFGNLEKAVGKVEADIYTISIKFNVQEVDLAKTEGYKDFLEIVLLRRHETVRGSCYLCGSESVLIDPGFPSGSLLKMYVLDKKGFLSGISDSDLSKMRTFSICPGCLKKLLTGIGYIERNLHSTIGNIDLYLIPRSSISIRKLERFIEFVKDRFDTVKSYKNLINFDQKLRSLSDYVEHAKNEPSYTLNLIFGRREQASFNFYDEISEIPVSSLTSFINNARYLTEEMSKILGDKEYNIDFEAIYRIFPLSLRKTKAGLRLEGYSPLILLYSSLLHRHIYPEGELMKRALLFIRIHRYGLYGAYNIRQTRNGDIEICYGIVKFNMLLKILKGDLSTESPEGHETEISNQNSIKKYFELMKYENWQKALFLLGYLVGQVGSKQYSKGDEKKAILSKINFDGMGRDKVMILSNQILESLRNYKILSYNEVLYAEMKCLLDNNLDRVSDPVKNAFYILSGYAFSTIKSIKANSYGDGQNE